jgi:hypothetical protein
LFEKAGSQRRLRKTYVRILGRAMKSATGLLFVLLAGLLLAGYRAVAEHYPARSRRNASATSANRISRQRLLVADSACRRIRPKGNAPLR